MLFIVVLFKMTACTFYLLDINMILLVWANDSSAPELLSLFLKQIAPVLHSAGPGSVKAFHWLTGRLAGSECVNALS